MTAPAPLATVADVQARTEVQLTAEQQARAAVLVGDASAIVRARVPDLPDPPPATAPGVIATAVLRALASPPDGNKSETVGGHSRTPAVGIAAAAALGALKLGVDGLNDALTAETPADYAKAVRDFPPAMRETTDAVRALRPALDGLKLDVQARLFEGLGGEVSRLGDRYLPVLRDGLVGIAEGYNQAARQAAGFAGEARTVDDVRLILDTTGQSVRALAGGVAALLRAIRDIAAVGSESCPASPRRWARARSGSRSSSPPPARPDSYASGCPPACPRWASWPRWWATSRRLHAHLPPLCGGNPCPATDLRRSGHGRGGAAAAAVRGRSGGRVGPRARRRPARADGRPGPGRARGRGRTRRARPGRTRPLAGVAAQALASLLVPAVELLAGVTAELAPTVSLLVGELVGGALADGVRTLASALIGLARAAAPLIVQLG
ncbi:hypothetical protein [Saccharothrix xinjiangensis]|uniref:Uncharacterized protein n=1 Tax=Saccharothrix xinjiangensis TaxID=204798 RepID=A0ABV9YAR8_9PSEU